MKDKIVLFIVLMMYTSLISPKISHLNVARLNSEENKIEIVVAEDFWDFLSRFTIITE